jgi:RNA recognition motif-containing protein
VTNLPNDVEEKEIKEFFEGFKLEDEPIQVTEISLVFNT